MACKCQLERAEGQKVIAKKACDEMNSAFFSDHCSKRMTFILAFDI